MLPHGVPEQSGMLPGHVRDEVRVIFPGIELGGRYRVVRLLGEGAMGAVYEAEHVLIGKRVAVKVLHERFSQSAEAVARFHREARAAAAIGHPHIVDVLDFGTHELRPYIVMELLRGETLAERMAREEPVAPSEACRIVGQVLSALAAAHAIGVVHRDLKPENVILVGGARAKLVDFGVSKFREAAPRSAAKTREGMLFGTPGYMAPEQWVGAADADHRADLFSAGVILYELLTGGLPYEGATRAELYQEIVHGTADPPAPSAIAPEVPAVLDAAVLTAVARDREKRFRSAAEFLSALVPHGAAESTGAHVPVLRASAPSLPPAPPPEPPRAQPTLHELSEDRAESPAPQRFMATRPRATVVLSAGALLLALSVVAAARARAPERAAASPPPSPRVATAPSAPPPVAAIAAPSSPEIPEARAEAPRAEPVAPREAPRTTAPRSRSSRHGRTRVTHRW